MGGNCIAIGCHNNKYKKEAEERGVSYHTFPIKDPDLLKIWLRQLKSNRDGFQPTKHSRLCSDHFEEDSFKYQLFTGRRLLKKNSIPSRFYHFNNMKLPDNIPEDSTQPAVEKQEVQMMQLNLSSITMDPGKDEAVVNHLVLPSESSQSKKRKRNKDEVGKPPIKDDDKHKKFITSDVNRYPAQSQFSIDPGSSSPIAQSVNLFNRKNVEISQVYMGSRAGGSVVNSEDKRKPRGGRIPAAKSRDIGESAQHTFQEGGIPIDLSAQNMLRKTREPQRCANNVRKLSQNTAKKSRRAGASVAVPVRSCNSKLQGEQDTTTGIDLSQNQSTGQMLEEDWQLSDRMSLGEEATTEPHLSSSLISNLKSFLSQRTELDSFATAEGKGSGRGEQNRLSFEEPGRRHPHDLVQHSPALVDRQEENLLPLSAAELDALHGQNPHQRRQRRNKEIPHPSSENRLLPLTDQSPPTIKLQGLLNLPDTSPEAQPSSHDRCSHNDTSSNESDKSDHVPQGESSLHRRSPSIFSKSKQQRGKSEDLRCRFCNKAFKRSFALSSHILRAHKNHNELDVVQDNLQYVCMLCKKAFKSLKRLNSHLDKHKAGDYHNACELCGKVFHNPSVLEMHLRKNSCIRKYNCRYCGKEYRYPGNLKQHEVTHAARQVHKCEICGKELASREVLRRHKLLHKGPAPFKCGVCGNKFYQLYNLRHHMRSRHNLSEIKQVKLAASSEHNLTESDQVEASTGSEHSLTDKEQVETSKGSEYSLTEEEAEWVTV